MSDLVGESESEVKEAPTDVKGMVQFAIMLVAGTLTLLGINHFDLLGLKSKPKATESKSDEETQADYEKDYLDEDISDEALDEHTVGLTA